MRVCGDPWAFPRRRIQNAVLVRRGWPAPSPTVSIGSRGLALSPRGVMLATVDHRVSVLSVHLGLSKTERTPRRSAVAILEDRPAASWWGRPERLP